ncbi:hypothetical protein [Vibrio nigripulchritudo]|uniref:hypothetical protein n=1 Tax=Vibrio nigripulchritudo TaxID=28173 RepID=UPI00068DEB29|nr:hypothetical protein [Vibrio nigripulchritudo]
MAARISEQQKRSLLELHINECKGGLNTSLATGRLRLAVAHQINKNLKPNHFLVGLIKLQKRGYLTSHRNHDRQVDTARSNENIWTLTPAGRAYAETLYSARLRPKRAYVSSSKSK